MSVSQLRCSAVLTGTHLDVFSQLLNHYYFLLFFIEDLTGGCWEEIPFFFKYLNTNNKVQKRSHQQDDGFSLSHADVRGCWETLRSSCSSLWWYTWSQQTQAGYRNSNNNPRQQDEVWAANIDICAKQLIPVQVKLTGYLKDTWGHFQQGECSVEISPEVGSFPSLIAAIKTGVMLTEL